MVIVWSKKAKYNFYNIQNYLEQFWSTSVADKFTSDVVHVINLLIQNPCLGKYRDDLQCREILITKRVKLYYGINENHIILIALSNNRQKQINIHDL